VQLDPEHAIFVIPEKCCARGLACKLFCGKVLTSHRRTVEYG